MSDIYDRAFRTEINDCPKFLLPFLNEVFGEKYTGKEKIVFHPNEHFAEQNEETNEKRITDTSFTVHGAVRKEYHLECESSKYSSKMLIRIFEYDAQIALDHGKVDRNSIKVSFPNTAVLYLRSNRNTPDRMNIIIDVPGDSAEYEVPVIKMKDYTANEIFEKKLYLLIPFYIFNYEKKFAECSKNQEEYEKLAEEFSYISEELKRLTESGEITSFDKRTMEVLSKEVIVYLAEKYKKVKRGIGDIMCGPMIETDARMLVNKGIEMGEKMGEKIGEKKGEKKGRQNGIISAIKAMEMLRNNEPEEKIIKQTGLSKEELDKLTEQYR